MHTWAQPVLQHQARKALWHVEQILHRWAAAAGAAAATGGGQAEQHGGRHPIAGRGHQGRLHRLRCCRQSRRAPLGGEAAKCVPGRPRRLALPLRQLMHAERGS